MPIGACGVRRVAAACSAWLKDGLPFTCVQCGKCCKGPDRLVWVNAREIQAMAGFLGIAEADFIERHVAPAGQHSEYAGRWLLQKKVGTSACTFLGDDNKCMVHEAKPTQCATYPFWPQHLISEYDWNAESRKCDGMGQLQVGSEQRHSCQHNAQPLRGEQHLLAENRTSFSEIVENMVIQEVAESGDLQLTHGELRDLLLSTSDSLLDDFEKEFWERNSRRVVHKDAVHAVLDTRLAGEPDQLTRALVRLDSPGYIQTEVVLNEKDDGAVAVSHTQLPQRPHQGLLLSLLMLQPRALRSSTMDNDANPSRATCSRGELEGRQDCTATEAASAPVSQLSEGLVESKEKGKPSLNIAVIGAGCGALPCALCANDFGHDVHVDAVDSDPDVLSVGKQWFDFRPGPQLNIYAMDGLDFLNSQSEATYDAILIDITAPSSTPGAPLDCPPYEVMFQDGLYSLAQSRLRSGGVMAINVLGGLTKLRQVAASAAAADGRHHIRALHLPSQSVLFAVKLGDGTGQPEFGDGSAARAGFAATGKAATQRFSDAMPGALGISIACQDTLNEIAEFARKEGHQYGWKSRSALLGDVQVAEQKF